MADRGGGWPTHCPSLAACSLVIADRISSRTVGNPPYSDASESSMSSSSNRIGAPYEPSVQPCNHTSNLS